MRVITIQRIEVIEQLKKNGKYRVDDNAPIGSNLIKPYKFMMKHYGYSTRPIFMCPIDTCANFGGACTEKAFVIEMEIPDRFCKVQDYYMWSDFIYFMELPNEWEKFNGCETVEQYGHYLLDINKNGFNCGKDAVYQVTTQFIHKNWIKKIIPINEAFIDAYVNTGGINRLSSIM